MRGCLPSPPSTRYRSRLGWAWIALLPLAALASPATERQLLDPALANAPGRHLTAITVAYAPGQASGPHRHPGAAFVYVLAGSVRSALAGEPERVYRVGESWFEPPGAHHLVSANASEREPARLLVIFIAAPGAPLSVRDAVDRPPVRPLQPPADGSGDGRRPIR